MKLKLFAHAGEFHTETTTSLEHNLTQPWLLAVVVLLIAVAWWRWGGRWRLPGVLGTLLIAGIATYELAPVLSVASISAGFILALGTMFASAQSDED